MSQAKSTIPYIFRLIKQFYKIKTPLFLRRLRKNEAFTKLIFINFTLLDVF